MAWQEDTVVRSRSGVKVDEGLRQHMLKVYNYMTSGLALTGIVALIVASSSTLVNALLGSNLVWLFFIAQIGMVFFLSMRIAHMKPSTAQALFWLYSALMGVTMASLLLVYTGESVARVFFITAGTFAAMSLYGYTTKKDLSGLGTFLIMGVIGLVIASVVNFFLHSSGLSFIISIAGVLIFTGLTAYDTQKIKEVYYEGDSADVSKKKAIIGALSLYLDFINLFIMLLRLLGDRR